MSQSISYYYKIVEESLDNLNLLSHACTEHAYAPDFYLQCRIKGQHVKAASCFNKDVDVAEIIREVVESQDGLVSWLKDPTNNERIFTSEEGEYPNIGRKFLNSREHNWEDGAIPCNQVVVICGKHFDEAGCLTDIYVKTCYPQ